MISPKMILFAVFLMVVAVQDTTAKIFFAGNLLQNEPPPPKNVALMARYITHNSDWASVGTISVNDAIKGYPFVGLASIADGPENNGTGIPYMLMTDMDITINDINHDNRCTLFMSLAQGDYCKSKSYDPEDPRCARVMLPGKFEKVQKGSAEEIFARNALYAKHPSMSSWPTDHGWFIAKLNIVNVFVFDFFGGIKQVTPQEYFAASENNYDITDKLAREIEVIHIY